MKIVHLIDYFQPKLGYQETFLAREHFKKGHEVYVVTSDRYFPFPHYDDTYRGILGNRRVGKGIREEEAIKTVRLESFEFLGKPLLLMSNLSRVIHQIQPDLVICHGVYSFSSYQIAQIHRKSSFILIYDNHTSNFNTNFNGNILTKMYHLLFLKIASKRIVSEAQKIFCIGDEERELLCRDFQIQKKDIPIIPLGVDVELFRKSNDKTLRTLRKLGWNRNSSIIVYSGKIWRNKDVDILAHALARLKGLGMKLLIIGGGDPEYLNEIKKILTQGCIDFRVIPFVTNSELADYYNISKIGIWPGNPSISFLEAMSCGLPVILPRLKETKYLEKSYAVEWFTRGSVVELSKKIRKILEKEKVYKKMSLNGQKFIKENRSWEKISLKIFHLFGGKMLNKN